mmetsp:Transcript_71168/g.148436  ORF Transcript_71168/g.148436 Transcript_71168/m.148436 type:complete len:321 (-) Transcript_71168:1239-2201(-)
MSLFLGSLICFTSSVSVSPTAITSLSTSSTLPIHSSLPNWSSSLTCRTMSFSAFSASSRFADSKKENSSSHTGLRFSWMVLVRRLSALFDTTMYGSALPPMSLWGRLEAEITRITMRPTLGFSFSSSPAAPPSAPSRSSPRSCTPPSSPGGFTVTSSVGVSPGSISGSATAGPSSGTRRAYSSATLILPCLACVSSYQPSVQPLLSSSVATLISSFPMLAVSIDPPFFTSMTSLSSSSSCTKNSANSFHLGAAFFATSFVRFTWLFPPLLLSSTASMKGSIDSVAEATESPTAETIEPSAPRLFLRLSVPRSGMLRSSAS